MGSLIALLYGIYNRKIPHVITFFVNVGKSRMSIILTSFSAEFAGSFTVCPDKTVIATVTCPATATFVFVGANCVKGEEENVIKKTNW